MIPVGYAGIFTYLPRTVRMKKDRKYPRRRSSDYLFVVDRNGDKMIGRVGNLSLGGVMVIGDGPMPVGDTMHLKLAFGHKVLDRDHLEFEAECRWSARNDLADWWETGFEIHGLSQPESAVLQQFLRDMMQSESDRLNAKASKSESTKPRLEYIRDRSVYDRHMVKTHLKG